ncbi:MAG: GNAT family protein [Coriobacteriales bacterium]|jgi:RimJ/RimL family protein N-acetyltransferase
MGGEAEEESGRVDDAAGRARDAGPDAACEAGDECAGRGLRLRGFDARVDVEPLFEAYLDPREQALFATRAPICGLQQFDEWVEGRMGCFYHDFRVVEAPLPAPPDDGGARDGARRGEFAGFVYSYDYSEGDQRCNVCLYLTRRWRATGAAGRVASTFLDELFAYYPLRKVYLYVYDYNRASLESDLQAGFVEEGLLRGYRYYDGRWWDCHVLAMTREAFRARLARFSDLGRVVPPDPLPDGARDGSGRTGRAR